MEFLKANAAKIGVVAVLLIVAGYLTVRNVGDTSQARGLPDEIQFVCVQTGKLYSFHKDGPIILPRENPDTGEETLMPVYEQDGAYYVDSRRRGTLERMGEKNKLVDVKTLKVRRAGD